MNELLLRRRVAASKSLPYDAEIEYLESTGTQYINTGAYITAANANDFYIKYGISKIYSGNDVTLFGVLGTGSNQYCWLFITSSNTVRIRWCTSTRFDSSKVFLNDVLELYGSGNKVYNHNITRNNTVSGNIGTYYPNLPFSLFGRTNGSADAVHPFGYCRIYECRIGNVHLIPVRKGTTGYLYDKVSKQLFGNAGTGSFILGNDI